MVENVLLAFTDSAEFIVFVFMDGCFDGVGQASLFEVQAVAFQLRKHKRRSQCFWGMNDNTADGRRGLEEKTCFVGDSNVGGA